MILVYKEKMFKKIGVVCLSICLLIVSFTGCQLKTNSKSYERTIETARTEIWKELTAGGASSAMVAIMDNGKIVYEEGFGMLNREKAIPVEDNTQYNIGSVSKIFTSAAVLLLCEEGKLELDEAVVSYMPEFKMKDNRYKDITVRMLLNHSSGMPGTFMKNAFGTEIDPKYLDNFLVYLSESNLKDDPGEVSVYCNDGFTLAEVLIEKVSGESFADFLEQRIFSIANMKNSSCYFKENNLNIATQYNNQVGNPQPVEYVNVLATGGISSTAVDLCKYGQALLTDKILNEESLALYQTEQYGKETVPNEEPIMKVGLGWDTVSVDQFAKQGVKVLSKNGATLEYNTMFYLIPEERLSVAILFAGSGNTSEVANAITQSLLEEKGVINNTIEKESTYLKKIPIPNELLMYEGYYGSAGEIFKIKFDQENGMLIKDSFINGDFVKVGMYTYKEDGCFHGEAGKPISFGETHEKKLIVTHNMDSSNGFVIAENIEPIDSGIDGNQFYNKRWLPINLSATEFAVFGVSTGLIDELPGYIYYYGDKLTAYALEQPKVAKMALMYARDLVEPQIIEENGQNQLHVMGFKLIDSVLVENLKSHEIISIDDSGDNEVRRFENNGLFSVIAPEEGRIIIFTPELEIQYDSLINAESDQSVVEESYLVVIGNTGDQFEVNYLF